MPRADDQRSACRRRLNARHQIIDPKLVDWWRQFSRAWESCNLCPLHEGRDRVVHFRGRLPAPVLLIGEAPGVSEDEIGRPFVGSAGDLLDGLLESAGLMDGDYCIVNTVGCIPLDDIGTRPPEKDEVRACNPRLASLIDVCQPKLVCLLGRIAAAAKVDRLASACPVLELAHPASLLPGRSNNVELNKKRFVLTLQEALKELKL